MKPRQTLLPGTLWFNPGSQIVFLVLSSAASISRPRDGCRRFCSTGPYHEVTLRGFYPGIAPYDTKMYLQEGSLEAQGWTSLVAPP